jgi:hypothetical protein
MMLLQNEPNKRMDAITKRTHLADGCYYKTNPSSGWMLLQNEPIWRMDAITKRTQQADGCYYKTKPTGEWVLLQNEPNRRGRRER